MTGSLGPFILTAALGRVTARSLLVAGRLGLLVLTAVLCRVTARLGGAGGLVTAGLLVTALGHGGAAPLRLGGWGGGR